MSATEAAPTGLAARAEVLRALHRPGRPVWLANIWDAAGARAVAAAGFPAVATSSAAVAESLGHADGQQAPVAEMMAAAARIAAAVPLPVTVDAEAGYGLPAAELVDRLLEAGAVGCNLEDTDHAGGGLVEPQAQAEWLASVRAATERAGVPLVINARIDLFLRAGPEVDHLSLVDAAVHRAHAYFAAGADCVYPILAAGQDTVRRLIEGVDRRPVNVNCRPGALSPEQAVAAGAARVSLGAGLWRTQQQWLAERLAAWPGLPTG
jgi:2-methylisocitrate lyase-like PEP mutase family enzyme